MLWASERSGHKHLELRAHDGSLVRVLTAGAINSLCYVLFKGCALRY
jgi:hypothetical protein